MLVSEYYTSFHWVICSALQHKLSAVWFWMESLFLFVHRRKCYIAKSSCTQSVLEEYIKASRFFFFRIFFIKYQTFFLNFSNYRIYVCIHIYNNILVSLRINSCCKCWTFQINYSAMKLACCENIQLRTISKTSKEILRDFKTVSDVHV